MSKDNESLMPAEGDGINQIQEKLSALLEGGEADGEDEEISSDDVPSEDDAPEDQASEENEGDEPDQPAIEPPSSWDSEAKARFAKLPPDLQEYISTRERDRDAVTSQRLQMAAEERRAAQEQSAEIAAMRGAYEQRLLTFAKHLESTIPEEFREIRSNADLVRLADVNPALVTKFHAWQAQVSSVAHELAQVQQQKAYEAQVNAAQERAVLVQQEYAEIAQKWPEFVDPQKGAAIKNDIAQYARQLGFTDDEIETLADHRLVLVLRDALAGRKAATSLQSAQKKVAARPLPKVVKPGSGEQASRAGVDRVSAAKVARSGDRSSIQRTLERMLSS
jgi:hypothetical protein